MKYFVPKVPADIVVEIVVGIYSSIRGEMSVKEIAKFGKEGGMSIDYARKASLAATQLGMIKKEGRIYKPLDCHEMARARRTEQYLIFRKYLNNYKPFITFLKFIWKEYPVSKAIWNVKQLYYLSNNERDIKYSLINWGGYADIIEYDKDNDVVILKEEFEGLTAEYLRELVESLKHETKTYVYLNDKLTDEVFRYLERDEIGLLIESLRAHEVDPRGAINKAGQALENFLRMVALDKNVDVSNKDGIGQIADALFGKGTKIINRKHFQMCHGINSARIAASHSRQKTSMKSWNLKADFAIEIVLLVLSLIRSIYKYVFEEKRVM